MLEQMGAAEVIAVEASTRAWLKCLTLKELTGMTRVRFLCGDSVAYLRENPARADAIIASGILYHMTNPVELIAEIAAHTDRMFLWTCCYDEAIISRLPVLEARFGPARSVTHAGFTHTVHPYHYRSTRFRLGFSGGVESYSHWLTRDTILQALRHFGLDRIETAFEEPGHGNGPAFALVASRTRHASAAKTGGELAEQSKNPGFIGVSPHATIRSPGVPVVDGLDGASRARRAEERQIDLSRDPQGRSGRRLLRHQGRRSRTAGSKTTTAPRPRPGSPRRTR